MACCYRLSRGVIAASLAALLGACMDAPTASKGVVSLAKPGSGGDVQITVSSATPNNAPQDTTLDITVGGSNFDSSAEVFLGRNGVPSAHVVTHSTRYVNQKQLVARVTITMEAEPGTYDVIVQSKIRKGGIGTELFEVRQTGQIVNAMGEWTIHHSSTGFGLRGDSRNANGTSLANGTSVYSNGQCGVTSEFFANQEGDVTIDVVGTKASTQNCNNRTARSMTVSFADRITGQTISSLASGGHFVNARRVLSIPVGESREQLVVVWFRKQSHTCQYLRFDKVSVNGTAGSYARVTRLTENSWEVESQPDAAGRHVGFCQTGGTGHPDAPYYDPGTLLGAYNAPMKIRIVRK